MALLEELTELDRANMYLCNHTGPWNLSLKLELNRQSEWPACASEKQNVFMQRAVTSQKPKLRRSITNNQHQHQQSDGGSTTASGSMQLVAPLMAGQ